jgi:hypothetical protein
MTEKKEKTEEVRLEKFKIRFETVQAFKAKEDTVMKLNNGEKYDIPEGDYYVMLDFVNSVVIKEKVFKKLFIKKDE